jgi:hypothetical protein
MSKIYYVIDKSGGGKFYRTEKQFFLSIRKDDKRKVIIYEECGDGIAGEILESTITQNERDSQLKVVLNEATEEEVSIYKLMEMIEETPQLVDWMKSSLIKSLKLIGLNKKEFSKLALNFKNFLLFEISDSVEWYQILLKCNNYTKLPDTYYKYETIETKWGKNFRRVKVDTEEIRIQNFLTAKKLNKIKTKKIIKNEKKN